MGTGAHDRSFAALFFSCCGGDTSVMYVSTPAPAWLGEEDLTKIIIEETGVYCLFFLVPAKSGAAELAVNGRVVRGSRTLPKDGVLCGSAVCSVHEQALPCYLEILTEGDTNGGVFLVTRVEI